jgi:hypothetical protein
MNIIIMALCLITITIHIQINSIYYLVMSHRPLFLWYPKKLRMVKGFYKLQIVYLDMISYKAD